MSGELNLDYSLLTPEFCLGGLAAIVLGLDLFVSRFRKEWLPFVTAAGLLGILGLSLGWIDKESDFAGIIFVDNFTTFFRVLFIATTATIALMSARYVREHLENPGEFYALLVLSTIGAIYMAAARELLTAYISLELLSFSLYVLVSFSRSDRRSIEPANCVLPMPPRPQIPWIVSATCSPLPLPTAAHSGSLYSSHH